MGRCRLQRPSIQAAIQATSQSFQKPHIWPLNSLTKKRKVSLLYSLFWGPSWFQLKELFESGDAFIVEEVQTTATRVQAAVQATIQSFQKHVETDSGVHLGADASIHPLTTYVLNYLKLLAG